MICHTNVQQLIINLALLFLVVVEVAVAVVVDVALLLLLLLSLTLDTHIQKCAIHTKCLNIQFIVYIKYDGAHRMVQ